jgi:MoaA/NifB/PqqE/SkfB family radical SAM enzyme
MSPATWTKLALEILYRNFKDSRLPFKYFLVVNKSCGSKCIHCHIWKNKPENEMSLDEYRLLAQNSKSNLIWLNISGGEPTDRLDLIEIIETFLEQCPNLKIINFTSNGLNFEQLKKVATYLNSLSDKLIGLNISIDGPADIHDSLRGIPGGYQKAIDAYKMVRTFSNIKSAAAMTLFPINHTLVGETIQNLTKDISDFVIKDLHLNYPHSSGHYYSNTKISFKNKIDISAVKPYFKRTHFGFSPFEKLERIYQEKLIEFTETGKTPIKCAAIRSNIYIAENGDVYPCTIWDEKLGSLRETDYNLSSILGLTTSERAKAKISQKNCPNCWSPCEAFPSLLTDLKGSLI